MLKEFKEFALKGNIMDLAIGVVIGGAFQKIVTSLVGNATIKYGNFITAIVNFLIIAFSIFIVVKYLNKLNRLKDIGEDIVAKLDKDGKLKKEEKEREESTTKICPYCLTEINYKATRCPNCTSELKVKEKKEKKT